MNHRIALSIDPQYPVGYITYRESEFDGSYRLLREPDGTVREYGYEDGRRDEGIGVVVELDSQDEVIALEIINVDEPDLVAIARDYAAAHDLEFPADLRAAARAST